MFIKIIKALSQFALGCILWAIFIHDEVRTGDRVIMFFWLLYNLCDLVGQKVQADVQIQVFQKETEEEPLF